MTCGSYSGIGKGAAVGAGLTVNVKGVGVGACASSTGIDEVDGDVAVDDGAAAAVGRVDVVVCTRSTDVSGNVVVSGAQQLPKESTLEAAWSFLAWVGMWW